MKLCALRCLILRPQNLILEIKFVENHFFLKNYVTSAEVLYYQQLPITRYQVRFDANNYFE